MYIVYIEHKHGVDHYLTKEEPTNGALSRFLFRFHQNHVDDFDGELHESITIDYTKAEPKDHLDHVQV
jgi:hypothetical protein